jgi:pimeloyl-ACP methyl ester carboxylesterase
MEKERGRNITMRFHTFGNKENPVMVMLSGSLCLSTSMSYLYDIWQEDFYIIAPDYNGYDGNSTFSTRQQEAKEVVLYLKEQGLTRIKMVYGQSMGAEIAIELVHQLLEADITVDKVFLDGAPCIKLPKVYKAVVRLIFLKMLHMLRDKKADDVMNIRFVKQLTNGDTESLRPMMEPVMEAVEYLTDESVINQTECCYTFDFPVFEETFQKNLYFFYAKEEKAYKTCFKKVKKAYPKANYKVVTGYGHMTYSVRETEKYTEMLRKICG